MKYGTRLEIWYSLNRKEKKLIKGGLGFILSFGAISTFILPLIFTIPAHFGLIDYSTKDSVGDTINGIARFFIALLASILTFMAFYVHKNVDFWFENTL